jgi:hypothetical protein
MPKVKNHWIFNNSQANKLVHFHEQGNNLAKNGMPSYFKSFRLKKR